MFSPLIPNGRNNETMPKQEFEQGLRVNCSLEWKTLVLTVALVPPLASFMSDVTATCPEHDHAVIACRPADKHMWDRHQDDHTPREQTARLSLSLTSTSSASDTGLAVVRITKTG